MPELIAALSWVVLDCVVLAVSMFSPLCPPFQPERLPWLICSILQYMALQLPRYFEYDIVNGPASTSVEWIRVYVPGPWHPVAENTLGPAPEDSATYREWRKVYHFDVYWPRDWVTRGYQRLGHPHPNVACPAFTSGPDLMYAGLTSLSASSNSDGG